MGGRSKEIVARKEAVKAGRGEHLKGGLKESMGGGRLETGEGHPDP